MANIEVPEIDSGGICGAIATESPDKLREMWRITAIENSEVAMLFYKLNGSIHHTSQASGDERRVSYEDQEGLESELPDGAEKITLVHTHPGGTSKLSPGDILSHFNKLGDSQAVGDNPRTYATLALSDVSDGDGSQKLKLEGIHNKNVPDGQEVANLRKQLASSFKDSRQAARNGERQRYENIQQMMMNSVAYYVGHCETVVG